MSLLIVRNLIPEMFSLNRNKIIINLIIIIYSNIITTVTILL